MLKQKIGWLIVVFLVVAPSWCAAGNSSTGPRVFLPEREYEFQPVVEGNYISHEFVLYNRGDAPLRILDLKSG